MLKTYTYFIGCDTSKEQLNFAVWHQGQILADYELPNTVSGIRKLLKQLRRLDHLEGLTMHNSLFCIEHTGLYNAHLLTVLNQAKADLSLIAASQIKHSLGLQRGKDDFIDARRIAEYGGRFEDKLSLWQPPRKVLQQLQALQRLRDRLLKTRQQLTVPLQEAKRFMAKKDWELLHQNCQTSIAAINADIQQLEQQIQQLIDSDDRLRKLFKQIISVPGVGKVTAQNIITESNEFKDFEDPRKFACHVGIVPFPHTSGSSLRGKNRVSAKANKNLKKLLHLCALAASRTNSDLREYYLRKIEQGKHKMAVLNAMRNKIVHRVFALVRNDTMYLKNYQFSLHQT